MTSYLIGGFPIESLVLDRYSILSERGQWLLQENSILSQLLEYERDTMMPIPRLRSPKSEAWGCVVDGSEAGATCTAHPTPNT